MEKSKNYGLNLPSTNDPNEIADINVISENFENLDSIIKENEEKIPVDKFDLCSQGRNARYNFTYPGWKRILNIIRATNGAVDIGLCQGDPNRMVQALAFDVTGFVKYLNDISGSKPTILKRYENVFGNNDTLAGASCKITKVRVAYPKRGASYPNTDHIVGPTNPVNCYVDVYVDFPCDEKLWIATDQLRFTDFVKDESYSVVTDVKEDGARSYATLADGSSLSWTTTPEPILVTGTIVHYFKNEPMLEVPTMYIVTPVAGIKAFNMNYAGFSYSHNCEAIEEETDASDTGIYGEALDFYTVDVETMPYYLTDGNVHVAPESSTSWGAYGVTMSSDGKLRTAYASNADIDGGWNKYKVIVPYNLKYAVEKVLKGQKEQTYQLITRKTFAELDILHGAVPDGKSDAWREITIDLGKKYKYVFCCFYFDKQNDKSETRDLFNIFNGDQEGSCYLGIPNAMSNSEPRYSRARIEKRNGLWWADYTSPTNSSGGKISVQTTQTGFGFSKDLIIAPDGSYYEDHLGSGESITSVTIQTTMPSDGSGRTNPSGVVAIYGISAD